MVQLGADVVQRGANVFVPIIGHMANLSFTQGLFPGTFKTAQVLPLLKKPGMDKDDLASYRPLSNLSTISNIRTTGTVQAKTTDARVTTLH